MEIVKCKKPGGNSRDRRKVYRNFKKKEEEKLRSLGFKLYKCSSCGFIAWLKLGDDEEAIDFFGHYIVSGKLCPAARKPMELVG